jgi:hypothetical protein
MPKEVKRCISDFFSKLAIKYEKLDIQTNQTTITIKIETDESGLLI